MALDDFPPEKRAAIELAVAQPSPPPRYLELLKDEATGRALATIESRAWYEWHWARGIEPGSIRHKIPKRLRREVIERDGLVCGICSGAVEPDDVHIDHVHPVAAGGTDDLDNLQVAHSRCNMSKGARIDA